VTDHARTSHYRCACGPVLVRIMAGSVFVSEGIQKFLYPEDLAAGRFAKIGIPAPEVMGPFGGGCEVVCGALLIIWIANTAPSHRAVD
jgi:putative oxidoreductase